MGPVYQGFSAKGKAAAGKSDDAGDIMSLRRVIMPRTPIAAWDVELAAEERQLLLEVLSDKLEELKLMMARSERRDVTHGLAERERRLEALIARFSGSRLPA
jgi:hypothetical protein